MNPFRTPDYMMYIARVSKELGPETIIIARTGELIEWFACGRKGSYRIKGLGTAPKLSLFARGKSVMSQFRKGWIKPEHLSVLRSYTPAPIHPYGRPNTPGFPGTRTKDPETLTDALSTDLSKPLSRRMQGYGQLCRGLQPTWLRHRADPIFSLPNWAIPARIFLITRRKDVLDHLFRIADPAIILRNGFEVNGTKYGVRFGGPYQRHLNLHDFCVGRVSIPKGQGRPVINSRHEYVRSEIPLFRLGQCKNDSFPGGLLRFPSS